MIFIKAMNYLISLAIIWCLIGPSMATATSVFKCHRSKKNLCKMKVTLPEKHKTYLKRKMIDFDLYVEGKQVFDVDKYWIRSLKTLPARGTLKATIEIQGRWLVSKARQRQIIRTTVTAEGDLEI